jgi:hypothetical protein
MQRADILKNHKITDAQIHVAGIPAVSHWMKIWMLKDMGTFMAVAVLTILLFLFIIFRRISGILLPLLIVVLSLVSTIVLLFLWICSLRSAEYMRHLPPTSANLFLRKPLTQFQNIGDNDRLYLEIKYSF